MKIDELVLFLDTLHDKLSKNIDITYKAQDGRLEMLIGEVSTSTLEYSKVFASMEKGILNIYLVSKKLGQKTDCKNLAEAYDKGLEIEKILTYDDKLQKKIMQILAQDKVNELLEDLLSKNAEDKIKLLKENNISTKIIKQKNITNLSVEEDVYKLNKIDITDLFRVKCLGGFLFEVMKQNKSTAAAPIANKM